MKHWLKYGLVGILLVGLGCRWYNLRFGTEFTWDQEQFLAFPAEKILVERDFPLVGAQTGVGGLFVGPLYSYLGATFFALFRMDPVAGAYLSATLATLTLIFGFVLVKSLFGNQTALIFITLMASSPFLIHFDRVPINVNLLPLATLLILSGLLHVWRRQERGWWLVGTGIFLSLNSHATSIFLIGTVLLLVIIDSSLRKKKGLIAAAGFMVGVLPLIVFNFRHERLLTQNLLTFLATSTASTVGIIDRVSEMVGLAWETIGRIFLFEGSTWIQKSIGLGVTIWFVKNRKVLYQNRTLVMWGTMLLMYIVGFSFYKGSVPDYYLISLILPTLLCISLLVSNSMRDRETNYSLVIIWMLLLMVGQGVIKVRKIPTQSLGIKQQVVTAIQKDALNQEITVNFDTDFGLQYGYQYLMNYYGLKQGNTQNLSVYRISSPARRFPAHPDTVMGDIALGFPETEVFIRQTKDIVLFGSFTLRIPKSWIILSCPFIDVDQYVITPDGSINCSSREVATEGLLATSLPECSIWDMPSGEEVRLSDQLPFLLFSAKLLPALNLRDDFSVLATATERQRCFVFADLANPEMVPLTPTTEKILTSIRPISITIN